MASNSRDKRQGSELAIGYKRPPIHGRFKPGVSGNPAGRTKSRKNLRGLFQQILNEQISLSDGQTVRKISKAEAALRSVVVGALRGDPTNLAMLLRVAEHTGEFRDEYADSLIVEVQRFGPPGASDAA
jgi:hypothetical protein